MRRSTTDEVANVNLGKPLIIASARVIRSGVPSSAAIFQPFDPTPQWPGHPRPSAGVLVSW